MVYPELNLELALAGDPIVMIWEAFHETKGWLHESKAFPGLYTFESERGNMSLHKLDEIKAKARMWFEPVVFNHWDFICPKLVRLEKSSDGVWHFWPEKGGVGRVFREDSFKKGFFPHCDIGTVIERPGVNNA